MLTRYQGAYANRVRRLYRAEVVGGEAVDGGEGSAPPEDLSEREARGRRSWARMLRRIYEVDPLICPRCGDELKIVSVITDPVVVDQILEHRERRQTPGLFDARAPPRA